MEKRVTLEMGRAKTACISRDKEKWVSDTTRGAKPLISCDKCVTNLTEKGAEKTMCFVVSVANFVIIIIIIGQLGMEHGQPALFNNFRDYNVTSEFLQIGLESSSVPSDFFCIYGCPHDG